MLNAFYITKQDINKNVQLTLTRETHIQLADEPTKTIEKKLIFTEISAIESLTPGKIINAIGVAESIGEVEEITTKANGKTTKRNALLVDKSGATKFTMWGAVADNFTEDEHTDHVIMLKGAIVTTYNNDIFLNIGWSTSVNIDPDIKETADVANW